MPEARLPLYLPILLLPLCLGSPLIASTLGDSVTLNGFGGWAAGDTDGNSYLSGAEDREYDSATFALAVTAEVSDRLVIAAQINSSIEEEETETDLEFAFAEWTFSDSLKLRGGIVKQPFGIYTEVFDLGTSRPFFDLPQGIYGPTEFVAEAYRGLGITGLKPVGSSWDLAYDLYGGEIALDSTEFTNPLLFDPDLEEPERQETIKDILGGRLSFNHTNGLGFGISAYFGTPESDGDDDDEDFTTHEVIGAHLQFLSGPWEVRTEITRREGGDEDVTADGFYFEIARRLGQHFQVAARWDETDYDLAEDVPESAQRHEDIAVSVNYWMNPNLVFKLSTHSVQGNLYAIPEDPDGTVENSTHLIQIGLQFSF